MTRSLESESVLLRTVPIDRKALHEKQAAGRMLQCARECVYAHVRPGLPWVASLGEEREARPCLSPGEGEEPTET